MVIVFFFQAEDGIRDTSVTGVQTCALPIFGRRGAHRRVTGQAGESPRGVAGGHARRSEERRVGKECRARWSPDHEKKKKTRTNEGARRRPGEHVANQTVAKSRSDGAKRTPR